jgi:hypothetical protein
MFPYGGFHEWGYPENDWLTIEKPKMKWMYLGVPPFRIPPHIDGILTYAFW